MKRRFSSHLLTIITALSIVFSACIKQATDPTMSGDTWLSGKDDGQEVELTSYDLSAAKQEELSKYESQQATAEKGCAYNRFVTVPRSPKASVRNPNTPSPVSGPCATYLVEVRYYSGGQEVSSYTFKLGPGEKRNFNTCAPGDAFAKVGLTVYFRNTVKAPRTSTATCN